MYDLLTDFDEPALIQNLLVEDRLMGVTRRKAFLNLRVVLGINLLKPTGHVMHQQFNIQ